MTPQYKKPHPMSKIAQYICVIVVIQLVFIGLALVYANAPGCC